MLGLLGVAAVACGGTQESPSGPRASSSEQGISAEQQRELEVVMQSASSVGGSVNTLAFRAHRADPTGPKVFTTPALPADKDAVTLLVELNYTPGGCGARGVAHGTNDGWQTTFDINSVQTLAANGKHYLVFDLGSGAKELAIRVERCEKSAWTTNFWLNNRGDNYQVKTFAAAKLQFVGHRAAWANGLPVDVRGGSAFAGQDVTVTVQTYPTGAGQTLTLHYTTDEYKTVKSMTMRFDGDGAGEYGNDVKWAGLLPTKSMAPGTKVRFWISGEGPQGTKIWDSANGKNYDFAVAQPLKVVWRKAGSFYFTKFAKNCQTKVNPGDYYNWCYSPGLGNPFEANYSKYQAYGSWPHFGLEIYAPGLTDQGFQGSAAKAAAASLRVEIVSDVFDGKLGGKEEVKGFSFVTTRGNNFVYKYNLVCAGGSMRLCAGPKPQNGDYKFYFRISADGGQTYEDVACPSASGKHCTLKWNFPNN